LRVHHGAWTQRPRPPGEGARKVVEEVNGVRADEAIDAAATQRRSQSHVDRGDPALLDGEQTERGSRIMLELCQRHAQEGRQHVDVDEPGHPRGEGQHFVHARGVPEDGEERMTTKALLASLKKILYGSHVRTPQHRACQAAAARSDATLQLEARRLSRPCSTPHGVKLCEQGLLHRR
jgi:hypothetical protein